MYCTPYDRRFFGIVCVALLSTVVVITSAGQWEPSVTTVETPVRIYPDPNRSALATLSPGTSVQIVQRQGDWVRISFWDKAYGDRTGFVRAEHVRGGRLNQSPTSASESRAQPTTSTAAPTDAVPPAKPESARTPATTVTPRLPLQFQNAQLTIPQGDKTKQVDVTVSYVSDMFQLLDKNTRKPVKEFSYQSFTGGEYSFSKAPRWKSGLFISPFLFLSSGKKHWLLVKTADDYAMLRLDKVNYKLIIAEWETRTGLTVEAQGEDK